MLGYSFHSLNLRSRCFSAYSGRPVANRSRCGRQRVFRG